MVQLAHLHIDSSFLHLPEALQDMQGFLSNLQTLKVTQDNDDVFSTFLWTKDATDALLALSAQCKRCLQKLLVSSSLLSAPALQHVADMAQLQHLELHVPRGTWRRPVCLAPWLQHVPAQQLTQLVLRPVVRGEAGACLSGLIVLTAVTEWRVYVGQCCELWLDRQSACLFKLCCSGGRCSPHSIAAQHVSIYEAMFVQAPTKHKLLPLT